MKNKQSKVLFEHSWTVTYDDMPESFQPWNRSFRVVAWSWEHDDGIRRIGTLHYEELTEDCMGNPIWSVTEGESVPDLVMGILLQKLDLIPPTDDLSDLR